MRPLKPAIVKQSLIAHYCSNEAVTSALWPLVFGMFFDKRNCSFRLLPGLVVSSLLRQSGKGGREAERAARGITVALSPLSEVPRARGLGGRIRKLPDLGPSISIGRYPAAESARRPTEFKAQACCPKFQTFGGTTCRAPILSGPSAFSRARPIEDGMRLFVERFREFRKLGYTDMLGRRPRRRTSRRKELKSLEAAALSVDVGISNDVGYSN
jgi:hypothetical protein